MGLVWMGQRDGTFHVPRRESRSPLNPEMVHHFPPATARLTSSSLFAPPAVALGWVEVCLSEVGLGGLGGLFNTFVGCKLQV